MPPRKKTEEEWAAFEEIASKYYGDGQKNLLTVPPQNYERQATNGIWVKLGQELYSWRRQGRRPPSDMPPRLKEFLEGCGAIGDVAKAVAPTGLKYSSDARWEAFEEIARAYYGDGQKNLLTLPPVSYSRWASNGIKVNLGQDLFKWRQDGADVPKSMPPRLKEFLEYCGAIGALARVIAPGVGRKKNDNRREVAASFSEGAGVVSGDHGERAHGAVGYSSGYGRQHGGAGPESFPQGVMGSVQQPAGGEYSYGGDAAATARGYQDGGYSGGYGGQVPDRVGTPPGYERQYAGTEWESFRPIDGSAAHLTTGAGGAGSVGGYVVPAGPAQQAAVGAYSYGGHAVTEDYRSAVYSGDGAYLSGYGGQYAGTGGESYQQFDPNAARLTTAAGPAPTDPYYDNSGNPPPADYSRWAPGNPTPPRR